MESVAFADELIDEIYASEAEPEPDDLDGDDDAGEGEIKPDDFQHP